MFNILDLCLRTVDVINLKKSDDDIMRVGGCVFTPSGHLLLVDTNKSEVMRLDPSCTTRRTLKVPFASDIALLSDKEAIVTSGANLRFLEITPEFKHAGVEVEVEVEVRSRSGRKEKEKEKIFVPKSVPICEGWPQQVRGLATGGGLIYALVVCIDGEEDKGHIKVLKTKGEKVEEVRRIDAVQGDKVLFDKPFHLAASHTRIYVSGDAVTCLKSDGTLVYQYKNEQLGKVSGMYVDSKENVLACAYGDRYNTNDKFHVITANGKRANTKKDKKETSVDISGYNCNDCIDIRPSDGTLAMASFGKLYIFSKWRTESINYEPLRPKLHRASCFPYITSFIRQFKRRSSERR